MLSTEIKSSTVNIEKGLTYMYILPWTNLGRPKNDHWAPGSLVGRKWQTKTAVFESLGEPYFRPATQILQFWSVIFAQRATSSSSEWLWRPMVIFWPSKVGPRQYIHIGESFLDVCSAELDLGAPRHGYLCKSQSFMSNHASLSFNLFSSTRIASYYFISHTHNKD